MAAYASTLILICLAILSYFVHNSAVTISILILLVIKLTPLAQFFPYVEKQGIQIGIIILTVAVMAPLASGTLPASSLLKSFANWQSIVAIIVGVFVAARRSRRQFNERAAVGDWRVADWHGDWCGVLSRRAGRAANRRRDCVAVCHHEVACWTIPKRQKGHTFRVSWL